MATKIFKNFTLLVATPVVSLFALKYCGSMQEFKNFYGIFKKNILS